MAGLSRAAWARAPQGCAKLVGTRGTWMHFTVGSAHETVEIDSPRVGPTPLTLNVG